jgi:hypothetical protein
MVYLKYFTKSICISIENATTTQIVKCVSSIVKSHSYEYKSPIIEASSHFLPCKVFFCLRFKTSKYSSYINQSLRALETGFVSLR